MRIRLLALSAISVLCCLNAANAASLPAAHLPKPPLAIYYSFDAPPPAALFTQMQFELDRIFAPAGLRVTWRSTDSPRDKKEDFPGIVVFRFRGRCSFERAADPAGVPLAQTQISDGHVLPFGSVNCDEVRRFIAPAAGAIGRALARVTAHEIYHMLTGSKIHASQGIARPEHSRADLTDSTFTFAKEETNWLRSWVERQVEPAAITVPWARP